MAKNYTIAVIGMGLIGGSILKGLGSKNYRLIGITKSNDTLEKAISLDLADEYSTDISAAKNADLVFICTPINKILQTVDKIREITSPECIISDVASLKGFITDYVNDLNSPVNFIGGRPWQERKIKG